MPEISMCPSEDCPARTECYRNEASGTRANPWRQAWAQWSWHLPTEVGSPVACDGYWPDPAATPPALARTGGSKGA